MDITSLTSLISALRAETGKDSISPENVGYIMQQIVDSLNDAIDAGESSAQSLAEIRDKLAELTQNLEDHSTDANETFNGVYDKISTLDEDHGGYLLAAAHAFMRNKASIAPGSGTTLSFTGIEPEEQYALLCYNGSADGYIIIQSESGTPLMTVPAGKSGTVTYKPPFKAVYYGEQRSGSLYMLLAESDKRAVGWGDFISLSKIVSELQQLIDKETGAVIPDLDFNFSVDLI